MTLKDIKYVTQKTVTVAKNYSEYRFMFCSSLFRFLLWIFSERFSFARFKKPNLFILNLCKHWKGSKKRNFLVHGGRQKKNANIFESILLHLPIQSPANVNNKAREMRHREMSTDINIESECGCEVALSRDVQHINMG